MSTQNPNKEKLASIAKKIANLLNKADASKVSGDIAEYETFTSHANKLIIEYNLEMSTIQEIRDRDTKFDSWKFSEFVSYKGKWGHQWRFDLMDMIARHNFCKCTYFAGNRKEINVYGNITNVDNVVWLFNFLKERLSGLMDRKWKEHLFLLNTNTEYYREILKSKNMGCSLNTLLVKHT